MVNVTFMKFNKAKNSTKQPSGSSVLVGGTAQCLLLDNTSLTNPVIVLQKDGQFTSSVTIDPRNYNYVQISDFHRYYFITNVVHTGSLYTIYLSVDVLASYRNMILSSTQYVARSASSYDDNIVDTLYKTKMFDEPDRTATSSYDNSGYVSRYITSGGEPAQGQIQYFNSGLSMPSNAVCFGIIGGNGVGADYYVCTESNFITFMSNVFTLVPSDMGSLADGVKKLLLDLNQYIVSVVRLPVMPHTSNLGPAQTSVRLGSYDVNCTCYAVRTGYDFEEYFLTNDIALPQHPNIANHDYYALPPYSSYVLDFLPMGSVPLDAGKLAGQTSINVKWRIDYISGLALFKVGYFANNTTKWVTLYTDICQVGIPIPLSALKVDNQTGFGLAIGSAVSTFLKNKETSASPILDTATNIGTNIGQGFKDLWNAASRALSGDTRKMVPASENTIGNFFSKNTNLLDQVLDYAGSILGDVYTKGSTGSYLNIIAGPPSVRAFFIDQCENDDARFGRPLYQKKLLSTLTGFCVCQNANVSTTDTTYVPLLDEVKSINNLLNSGVFIE